MKSALALACLGILLVAGGYAVGQASRPTIPAKYRELIAVNRMQWLLLQENLRQLQQALPYTPAGPPLARFEEQSKSVVLESHVNFFAMEKQTQAEVQRQLGERARYWLAPFRGVFPELGDEQFRVDFVSIEKALATKEKPALGDELVARYQAGKLTFYE